MYDRRHADMESLCVQPRVGDPSSEFGGTATEKLAALHNALGTLVSAVLWLAR